MVITSTVLTTVFNRLKHIITRVFCVYLPSCNNLYNSIVYSEILVAKYITNLSFYYTLNEYDRPIYSLV